MKDKCHLFFETLGTRLKMRIISELKKKSLNVNELSSQIGQERSKVSHALKSLFGCGFVKVERKGRERIYSLNKDTIIPLLNLVEKHIDKYCNVCRKKRKMK